MESSAIEEKILFYIEIISQHLTATHVISYLTCFLQDTDIANITSLEQTSSVQACKLLIERMRKSKHPGWCSAFITALRKENFTLLANLLSGDISIYHYDVYKNLLKIFYQQLTDNLDPNDVMPSLHECHCLSDKDLEDLDYVKSRRHRCLHLLTRIGSRHEKWFSHFMYALTQSNYKFIVEEIESQFVTADDLTEAEVIGDKILQENMAPLRCGQNTIPNEYQDQIKKPAEHEQYYSEVSEEASSVLLLPIPTPKCANRSISPTHIAPNSILDNSCLKGNEKRILEEVPTQLSPRPLRQSSCVDFQRNNNFQQRKFLQSKSVPGEPQQALYTETDKWRSHIYPWCKECNTKYYPFKLPTSEEESRSKLFCKNCSKENKDEVSLDEIDACTYSEIESTGNKHYEKVVNSDMKATPTHFNNTKTEKSHTVNNSLHAADVYSSVEVNSRLKNQSNINCNLKLNICFTADNSNMNTTSQSQLALETQNFSKLDKINNDPFTENVYSEVESNFVSNSTNNFPSPSDKNVRVQNDEDDDYAIPNRTYKTQSSADSAVVIKNKGLDSTPPVVPPRKLKSSPKCSALTWPKLSDSPVSHMQEDEVDNLPPAPIPPPRRGKGKERPQKTPRRPTSPHEQNLMVSLDEKYEYRASQPVKDIMEYYHI